MGVQTVMAVEEAAYKVVKKSGRFEIREYAPQILADVIIEGDAEKAGNRAFRPLFRFIDGDNSAKEKIAMTAPVSQESTGQKIAMTAPVSQENVDGKWRISFMMPAGMTMDAMPVPDNPNVSVREKPAHRMAAIRYSGFWSEKNYLKNLKKLEVWMEEQGLKAIGEPVWARYNAPFVPWFLRRNECLIPVNR